MFRQLITECQQVIAEADQYQDVDRNVQTKTSGPDTGYRTPQRKMPNGRGRGERKSISNRTELGPEVPYSQPPLPEHALSPDLHRNSVRAIQREKRAQIPELHSKSKIRGRNINKPQVETPKGWRDIDEYGSPGRRFDAY